MSHPTADQSPLWEIGRLIGNMQNTSTEYRVQNRLTGIMAGYKLLVNQIHLPSTVSSNYVLSKAKMIYGIGIVYPCIQPQEWLSFLVNPSNGRVGWIILCIWVLSCLSFLVFVFLQGISCVVYDAGNDRCPPFLTSYTKKQQKQQNSRV